MFQYYQYYFTYTLTLKSIIRKLYKRPRWILPIFLINFVNLLLFCRAHQVDSEYI